MLSAIVNEAARLIFNGPNLSLDLLFINRRFFLILITSK